MSFNTYGKKSTAYGGNTPVWLGKGDTIPAGGSLIDQYVVEGALYPAGTPVHLSGMGGDLIPLEVFELQSDLSTPDTSIVISVGNLGSAPDVSIAYGILPASGTIITTASDVSSVTGPDVSGNYNLAFSAGAFGAASDGDYLVFAVSTGSSQSMLAPVNGLLWNDIYIETGMTSVTATGAVRDSGQVLVDRIPTVPASIQALLPKITFIKEE